MTHQWYELYGRRKHEIETRQRFESYEVNKHVMACPLWLLGQCYVDCINWRKLVNVACTDASMLLF